MRIFSKPDMSVRDGAHPSWFSLALVVWLVGTLPGCGRQSPPSQPVREPNNSAKKDRPETAEPVASAPGLKKPSSDTPEPDPAPKNPFAAVTGAAPQQVFRPNDPRAPHDDRKLAALGIRLYESKRLKLYTDIDPAVAATLPPVIDQAYDALVKYFGPLPPDRARTEFQMTGYLIKDDQLFREVGLIPEDLPRFEHGRHRRTEFWMREQKYDYYRRPLLIHEATHCFMTVMPESESL